MLLALTAGARAPVWHGSGRQGRDSLVGVLWAILMELQPCQGTGGHGHQLFRRVVWQYECTRMVLEMEMIHET